MGTQNEERFMGNDIGELIDLCLSYKEVVNEYFVLCLQPTLTVAEASRLQEILEQAQAHSILEFLLDEADHVLAHEMDLIDEKSIKDQQAKLAKSIDKIWCERLIMEIQKYPEVVQKHLQSRGFYCGPIDGKIGPGTQAAIDRLKRAENFNPH
ncbi:MAG: hypothetical protein F6K19_11050 [Cyanothece sp. SIO1E1]|nr:hypothetical protein [Cyanothece sp. SIO1E1]